MESNRHHYSDHRQSLQEDETKRFTGKPPNETESEWMTLQMSLMINLQTCMVGFFDNMTDENNIQ